MITYLLDTNICIYLIKQKPANVLERFQTLNIGDIGVSSITIGELHFGVNKSSFPEESSKALQKFLRDIEVMPFDYDAAIPYGKVRAQLQKSGKLIGPLDMLIAAHAISLNATLVTNNLKEFSRIEGLITENWV